MEREMNHHECDETPAAEQTLIGTAQFALVRAPPAIEIGVAASQQRPPAKVTDDP
jgi:hypothetical protein